MTQEGGDKELARQLPHLSSSTDRQNFSAIQAPNPQRFDDGGGRYGHGSRQQTPAKHQGSGMVIETRHTQPPPPHHDRQGGQHEIDERLRPARIRMLKIMSVVAAIVFPPTGIPAVVMAWRIRRHFEKGNFDKALRTARLCKRLCIISYGLVVMVVGLIVGILKRAL